MGVRYLYENQTPVKQEQFDSSFILNPSLQPAAIASISFQKLPVEWLANLKSAILKISLHLIKIIIEEIRTKEATLATVLSKGIYIFEYKQF